MNRRQFLGAFTTAGMGMMAGCQDIDEELAGIESDTTTEEPRTTVDPNTTVITITHIYESKEIEEHEPNPFEESYEGVDEARSLAPYVIPDVVDYWNSHSNELTDEDEKVLYTYEPSADETETDILINFRKNEGGNVREDLPDVESNAILSMEAEANPDIERRKVKTWLSFLDRFAWVSEKPDERGAAATGVTVECAIWNNDVRATTESLKTALGYVFGKSFEPTIESLMNPRRLARPVEHDLPNTPEMYKVHRQIEDGQLDIGVEYAAATMNISTGKFSDAEERLANSRAKINEVRNHIEESIVMPYEPYMTDTLNTVVEDYNDKLDKVGNEIEYLITEHIEKDDMHVGKRDFVDWTVMTPDEVGQLLDPPYEFKYPFWEWWVEQGTKEYYEAIDL